MGSRIDLIDGIDLQYTTLLELNIYFLSRLLPYPPNPACPLPHRSIMKGAKPRPNIRMAAKTTPAADVFIFSPSFVGILSLFHQPPVSHFFALLHELDDDPGDPIGYTIFP